jgi:hypothetical protein
MEMSMKQIPIVICIDVEPDERAIDPNVPKDWMGFEKTFEYFRKLRPRLEDATRSPVHFSWFFRMDPQIERTYKSPFWVATRYRSLIEEMESAGDALGLHTHTWRWDEVSSDWIVDLEDQEWVDHCVRMGFEAFRESLNRRCLAFRFGSHWMSNATIDLVERLGARFDLTLEPGQKKFYIPDRYIGSVPDLTRVPRQPYRPSKVDFRKRGIWRQRLLWMIPLSSGNGDLELRPPNDGRAKAASTNRTPAPFLSGKSSGSDVTNPVYEGFFDSLERQTILGWAYDANRPDEALEIEVYDDETLLAIIPAASFRPDLLAAGKGNGRHAFNVHLPGSLRDGKMHSIRVKIAGSNFELNGSPKEIDCSKVDWDEEFLLLLNTDPWVMSRMVDTLLCELKNPYLALPVRSEVTLVPPEFANMEQNFNNLLSHPLVERFVFETPTGLVERVV